MLYHTTLLVLLFFLSCESCTNQTCPKCEKTTSPAVSVPSTPLEPPKPNIEMRDLPKTVVTIKGNWIEEDLVQDDKGTWQCSGVIRAENAGTLTIITSRHCLGLEGLMQSEPVGGDIDVKDWRILVITHNDRELEVTDLTVQTNLDIAILHTRAASLLPDIDFRVAPFGREVVSVGDSVVCVQPPEKPGQSGTLTFGRINAVQENGRVFYHDAAAPLREGGDPVFVSRGIDHFWVGVNIPTFKIRVLREAVSVREIGSGPLLTVTVSPDGACRLLRLLFQAKCDNVQ